MEHIRSNLDAGDSWNYHKICHCSQISRSVGGYLPGDGLAWRDSNQANVEWGSTSQLDTVAHRRPVLYNRRDILSLSKAAVQSWYLAHFRIVRKRLTLLLHPGHIEGQLARESAPRWAAKACAGGLRGDKIRS